MFSAAGPVEAAVTNNALGFVMPEGRKRMAGYGSFADVIEKTERSWSTWSKSFEGAGQWSEAAIRSLITLRALIFQDSGGIVAAPTTSLPEQLGVPSLLAPRRDLHFARVDERGLRG